SFHAEVLDYVMNNLAVVDSPAPKGTGNETDIEQISVWSPDFIIFGNNSVYGDVAGDEAWSTIPAVANGNYVETPCVPYDWIGNPPSINRYLSMMWLTKALYPEYADFDLYEQIKEYYNLFYGHDLTEAQYNGLTANAFVK
ncbi:MAG: ABC transporter substrate-binding protein, partial [Clostridiales bacterium]|nr:ABC transporter substrate-binding protein [Clostridiales bacterium]